MAEDRHRESTAKGARLGILGEVGWFLRPERTRLAMDGVSPGTSRGARNALLWVVGFLAIGGIGRAVTQWSGSLWFLIALAVMIPIGWKWSAGQR